MVPSGGTSTSGSAGSMAAGMKTPIASPYGSKVRAACSPPASKRQAQCFALIRTDVFYSSKQAPAYTSQKLPVGTDLKAISSGVYFGPLGPRQIDFAYRLPSVVAGKGETVGIVDAFDDPNAESDLAVYRSAYGLPPCTTRNGCFTKLNQDSHTSPLPPPDVGWAEEISLDLDMVSATCPLCKIVLVEANDNFLNNLGRAEFVAQAAGAFQISNSYGGPEYTSSDPNFVLRRAVVVASSGDGSWYAGPQEPCAYATTVCVGGTSLFPYNNHRSWIETAWSYAGSGCSQFVPKPSFIPAAYGCGTTGMRTESDVSAVADPFTGVVVYDSYGIPPGFYVFGGTSVSSPIIASVVALAGNPGWIIHNAAGIWAAAVSNPSSLNDVTIGNNGQEDILNAVGQLCNPFPYSCYAMPHYDGPTGNGTPNGIGAF